MIKIDRLPEPRKLTENKTAWLQVFLDSGNKRPSSSQYAHKDIKRDLMSMSSHKCFYCESNLKGVPKEVDHHIEVAVDKRLAFEWSNLCLSCDNCNNKIAHDVIPIQDTLDPCVSSERDFRDNLTFNKELIDPKNNSRLGALTIKKYRLDTELLDARRLKQLSLFQDVLIEIQKRQIDQHRDHLEEDELNLLKSFKRPDKPYSLMFMVLLEKYGFD